MRGQFVADVLDSDLDSQEKRRVITVGLAALESRGRSGRPVVRFRSVRAYPFGPFVDDALHLAVGMNVVYGPNEAGKSTWHAALYAGLCGRRRGKPRKEQQWLADRHRPWSDPGWKVGVVVELADKRIVELEHDLSVRTGVARDADLAGRDYTSEILEEGAPDGSRWLGAQSPVVSEHGLCPAGAAYADPGGSRFAPGRPFSAP